MPRKQTESASASIRAGSHKEQVRAEPESDKERYTQMRQLLQSLTPKALLVLERQMDSEDEKIAHNAAGKILSLQESIDAWQSKGNVTVVFHGVPEPGLPGEDAPRGKA